MCKVEVSLSEGAGVSTRSSRDLSVGVGESERIPVTSSVVVAIEGSVGTVGGVVG